MGQYYKTSKPDFVEDFMYEPPWELAERALQNKDKKVNQEISLAGELGKVLNFESLDFDKDKADEKKLDYKTKIDSLVDKIKKDPMNYSKYGSELNTLREEMTQDFSQGEIADIMNTYAGAQKFNKDHDKFKEKEAARYSAGYNSFYQKAKSKRGTEGYKNSQGIWQSEQLMQSMDFAKGFANYVTKLKPNSSAYATTGSDGQYIYKRKGTNEVLSQTEVRKLMKDYIENTPNAGEYIDQTIRIGMADPTANLGSFADNFAYSKSTQDATQSGDPYGGIAAREASAKRVIDYREEAKGGGKNAEGNFIEELPLVSLLGDAMGTTTVKTSNSGKAADDPTRINSKTPMPIGYQSLISANVLKNDAQVSAMRTALKVFDTNKGFGDLQLVFVPQKSFKSSTTGKPFSAGRSYVMTMSQAKAEGMVSKVIPSSGQPFFHDRDINGVNFKFDTPLKQNNTTDPASSSEMVRANLVPSGSQSGVNRGIKIFQTYERK